MTRRTKRIVATTLAPFFLWSCFAIVFSPALPLTAGILLALGWAVAVAAGGARRRFDRIWIGATVAGIVVIGAIHFTRPLSAARAWIPDQENAVRVSFVDGSVIIENIRDRTFGEDGRVTSLNWESDTFPVDGVERVYFVHEILSPRGLVAHGFLTFAFSDGRHLAISVEARRAAGQSYHPLPGLFRNYELIYVIGRETDLIGERANVRGNPVYLYPIRTSPENARALFRSVIERADRLSSQPEYYNSVTNNCVTNILLHVNELTELPLRYDLRILFPGLADNLLHERELLDFTGTREEARERFRINERSEPIVTPREWSRQIREIPEP